MSRCTESYGGCVLAREMAGPTTIRVDLRAALPVAVFALIVLIIIFVQLCGTEDVKPLESGTPLAQSTRSATFTPGPGVTVAPTKPAATQAPQVGGDVRDIRRIQDLAAVQAALEQYKSQHNSKYPDTTGAIQTLCVFKEFDKACAIQSLLPNGQVPADPLGDPSTNGYWYRSDGTTYTLFAQRESTIVPECAEHPQHLHNFKSVMCALSP